MICRGQYMKNVYPPLYTLNGEVIKEVDSVRYLGHIISSNGKDDKDIMRQCQQLYMPLAKCNFCVLWMWKWNCLIRTYAHCAIMVEPHCVYLSPTKCFLNKQYWAIPHCVVRDFRQHFLKKLPKQIRNSALLFGSNIVLP